MTMKLSSLKVKKECLVFLFFCFILNKETHLRDSPWSSSCEYTFTIIVLNIMEIYNELRIELKYANNENTCINKEVVFKD